MEMSLKKALVVLPVLLALVVLAAVPATDAATDDEGVADFETSGIDWVEPQKSENPNKSIDYGSNDDDEDNTMFYIGIGVLSVLVIAACAAFYRKNH